jgi:adenosylmethionine-8-amino-7-oxononanoate aminotransferase
MEGALKIAREYFVWKGESRRVRFISRHISYHGTTLGSLSLSGHVTRRAPFEPLLSPNMHRVSDCNSYRQKFPGESDEAFAARKAEELEQKFQDLGPDTVAAFVAEPVVGAALGCVPSTPGYFAALKAVCDRHGALLILDEIMSGMGRTGTLHAWEQEGVVPDIQAVGKGLGGGYQPASALLVGTKVHSAMLQAGAAFTHGHTYQNHPLAAAAALKVQLIIQAESLLSNVRRQGAYLELLLRSRLDNHPMVGNIRGRGLFWGIEFVASRATKEPFHEGLQVARQVHDAAIQPPFLVLIYHGQGSAGGRKGDHIMISPAYDVDRQTLELLVEKVQGAVDKVYANMNHEKTDKQN